MAQAQDQLPSADALQRGYESITVSNRGLLIFLICFILTAVVLHWAMWVLIKYYAGMTRDADMPRSDVTRVDPFVDPRLQPSEPHPYLPWQDLASWRQEQQQVFDQLGWRQNQDNGRPHIPDDVVAALAARYATTGPSKTRGGGQP
ncbi:MAG TPA: hypothetical protein VLI90_04680 [Tepidisphaeraceae bacterium]|nr:hypothetical protein [Tepidisphaeraceae bacterium]